MKTKKILTVLLVLMFVLPWTVFAGARLQKTMDLNHWNPDTRLAIQGLIDSVGNSSPGYNPSRRPYAVFDWDQTCIFNDTEEALFRYMIENVLFKAAPENFAQAIRKDIPKDNFGPDFNNKKGDPVNIDKIAADLDSDYRYLYDNYINRASKDLAAIQRTPQYLDWRAKLAFLYEAIGGTFSADVSYPWVLYLFADMTVAEVRAVAEKSNDKALQTPIGTYSWESPGELPGEAGVISFGGYKAGLRIQPEMPNLMKTLRANGIDVYVCSASHETVVRVFAGLPKYGYLVPEENVIGMKTLLRDGKYAAEYDYSNNYPQTQGKGKTTAIKQVLGDKKGYGPVFVAGDSSGDYYMSIDFPDTRMTLVINRLRSDNFGELAQKAVYEEAGKAIPRFVLQGRDENTGEFRPSLATIKYGKTEEALLHDKYLR